MTVQTTGPIENAKQAMNTTNAASVTIPAVLVAVEGAAVALAGRTALPSELITGPCRAVRPSRCSCVAPEVRLRAMLVLDSQIHTYEPDHPGRPWISVLPGPASATGHEMAIAMDEAGVDGALLVSPYAMYRYDPSYALEVYAQCPQRFRLIRPVDPGNAAVADVVAEWAATEGAVGIRLLLNSDVTSDPADPGIRRLLSAAARHSLPVNVLCWGRLDQAAALAARYPDTILVVDHLGLPQPFEPPAPAAPWAELPKLLSLASYRNVMVKISGACTLSHRPYPYHDIWDPIERILQAFGLQRCMWGTDWTRAVSFLSYRQGVDAFRTTDRLSESDRSALMGGTLSQLYRWVPDLTNTPKRHRTIADV
jgi:L-fuconolactonase